MEKRILITGISLAICISLIIAFFFIRSNRNNNIDPLKAIPQNAAYIIRLNGFELPERLLNPNTKIWQDIGPLECVANLNQKIKVIDSLLQAIPTLHDIQLKREIYISGHLIRGNTIDYLLLLAMPSRFNERDIISILKKNKTLDYSTRKFEGKTILTLNLGSGRFYYFSVNNGLMIYSSSSELIEDAIRQISLPVSLLDNQNFSKLVYATGKNQEANIYLNLQQVGKLFSTLSKEKFISNSRNNKCFGDWAEMDINVNEDLILLNGFTVRCDSCKTFISAVTSKEPVKLTIEQVLPASISGFIAYGISSPGENYTEYLNYLKTKGEYTNYMANLAEMNQKYGVEFDKFFLSLIDNEIALAYKTDPKDPKTGTHYLIIKCLSGTDAQNELEKLANKIKTIKGANSLYTYSPDRQVSYTIYRIPIYPLFGRLLGDFFNVLDDNYITVIDNYIVIAGSYADAASFIYDYMLKKTLANDETYRSFASNLSTKSYLLVYTNLSKVEPYFEKYLNDTVLKNWVKHQDVFQKAQVAGLQISQVSNMPYFNVIFKHYDDFRGKPHTIWESRLDTTTRFKPKFVINHNTKENEIIIQDDKNNLYLLNQAGRILWQVPLNEKINSDIYQIDYFKNGKLQFLFSTKNYLHMVDRNGNYVERYPVKFRSEASTGISIFDYDGDKTYRIFVPSIDKQIYVYSKEGSIISGWNFKGSDYMIEQPLVHYRVENKDFIVFGDKNYTYILDRKGDERVKASKSFSKSVNNSYYLYNSGNIESSYLITTDTSGTLIKIYFSGKIETQNVQKFSRDHYFDFKDVNADGSNDYIFLDNNTLSVFSNTGTPIYTYTFQEKITQRPIYYQFSYSDRKIGLVLDEKQKIYLINSNGQLYKGFPLEGTTQFTIGYFDLTTSKFNLIVGGRNNFLYNYAVE